MTDPQQTFIQQNPASLESTYTIGIEVQKNIGSNRLLKHPPAFVADI